MVQDLVDAGMLAPEDAEKHPNANIITRAVGVNEQLRVDAVRGDARPGDQFLLASDGLTRLVDNDELAAVLTSRNPDAAADLLIETTLARGAPDNVTAIIVKVR
jgi:serine/threonine protein phosphatase PrpC